MSVPLSRYESVKKHVLTSIESGQYEAGDKLPSENELVKTLGVSRMTVNRALRELTEEGHITRRAGMGSFVAMRRMRGHAMDIVSIRDEVAGRGETWSATVEALREVEADEELAREFGCAEGEHFFYLLVVHMGDEQPIELEERWVNPLVAPDVLSEDFTATTPTDHLLAVAPLLRAEHVVRAIATSEEKENLLKIETGTPCLEITRKTWTGERVASFAKLLYPGDRYELTARFSNVGASASPD